ncbi:LacI family DNA-binding transcriptional regulator [Microbacteriaceae bacterium VKM Ac-2854]|nr:LacI family DNA-binding transcriptional regulator [Microbacteriaceae bacterium VKM Ac-2854]
MAEQSGPSAIAAESRPPTMKDVAIRAGVSRQLVSMALRDLPGPSERTRERVLAAAAEIGFSANASARLLRQSRSRLIGVLFVVGNAFEAPFVERILVRAKAAGYGVVLGPIGPERDTERVVTELRGHRIEALACFNPDPESPALVRAIAEMPVVWLGERSADPRADAVHADDPEGLRLAVGHLVELGHREIVYVGGRDGLVGPDRAQAYRDAMTAAGLTDGIDVVDSGFAEEEAAAAARRLLARPQLPTAVIVCSDQGAAAVRAVFAGAGVDVPGDVSIVGFDDSAVAALSFNSLTSVRQDVEASVAATLAAIVARLADPNQQPTDRRTPATLTIRTSTGAARTHR